jgi:predicted DNA binding CopG/RHH family protein
MKKKIMYTNNEDLGDLTVVRDFLPPPDQLLLREENVKVTIALSRSSVEYFKKAAKKNRTQYQKLIRKVLDLYASRFSGA